MRDATLAMAGAVIGLFLGALIMVDHRRDELERGFLIVKGQLYLVTPARPAAAP